MNSHPPLSCVTEMLSNTFLPKDKLKKSSVCFVVSIWKVSCAHFQKSNVTSLSQTVPKDVLEGFPKSSEEYYPSPTVSSIHESSSSFFVTVVPDLCRAIFFLWVHEINSPLRASLTSVWTASFSSNNRYVLNAGCNAPDIREFSWRLQNVQTKRKFASDLPNYLIPSPSYCWIH